MNRQPLIFPRPDGSSVPVTINFQAVCLRFSHP
jgi:hypothetical protein